MYKFGDIILADIQFTDTFEIKRRPALVLFEEMGNIVVAGITSNLEMKGIPLSKKDGSMVDSIIKLNYIFTISELMVKRKFFTITQDKKRIIKEALFHKLS